MKRLTAVLLTCLALLVALNLAVFHAVKAQSGPSTLSRVAGFYDSVAYRDWGLSIAAGNSATGAQTITVCPAFVALRDGRVIQPLAPANGVFPPITVDAPSSTAVETVTPTAYSLTNAPIGYTGNVQCANVTATFANTHGASLSSFQVISGDQGIQEAINDASLNGGGPVHWVIDPGSVTLSTGGLDTNLGAINIPTRSIVTSASGRVTVTIGTCAGGWALGSAGGGANLTATNVTLTAGTTTDSSNLVTQPLAINAAALPIVHCTTSNASAGAVHAHFEGYKVAAPAS
jgi:hypothetical protein